MAFYNRLLSPVVIDTYIHTFYLILLIFKLSKLVIALIGCKRCGRTKPPPQKIHQKMPFPLLHKILLYFSIAAPGRQWHVKKKRKKILSAACSTSARYVVSFVLVKGFFFRDHIVLRH